MNPMDRELLKTIRKIRDRIHAARIINSVVLGLAAALALGILLAAAARFVPIYGVYYNTLKLAAAAVAGAFLYSAFKTPRDERAAFRADSLGLEERAVTALELIGNQSVFARLEKADALERLKGLDYKKKLAIAPQRKYLLVCLLLSLVLAVSGFIPNPMAEKAEELHSLKKKAVEQQKKVQQLQEQIKDNPRLTDEQKKELEAKLTELKKELKSARNEKDISKALSKTEKKIEYMKQNYAGDDLRKLADALAKSQSTRALAELLKRNDPEQLKENIEKLAEELKKLSPEEVEQLAEDLAKLAEELKNNPELRAALASLSQKLAGGELGDLSEALGALSDSIGKLMQNANMQAALGQLARELGNMQSGQSNGQQGQPAQDGGGQQGQGNLPGSGNNPGQGSQSGSGGLGNGQGGGAGSGTSPGTENPAPVQPGSGLSKKDGSEKKLGEYEKIFTPDTLGGEGETSELSGRKGSGGSVDQVITEKGKTVRGVSVPYDQVVGRYKDKAVESIDGSDIPPGMKDMIKDYFTSLEE